MWLLVDIAPSGELTPFPKKHPTYHHYANSTYKQKTKVLHRACFSPSTSTWTQAIKKNFSQHGPASQLTLCKNTFPNCLPLPKGITSRHPPKISGPRQKISPTYSPTMHPLS
jgi:hypothetical protein